MKKARTTNNSVAILFTLITICCVLILVLSTLNLPEISSPKISITRKSTKETNTSSSSHNQHQFGKFAEMMIDMLPNDLAFTIFIPSEKAFEVDLKLHAKKKKKKKKNKKKKIDDDDTYALLSRILGFSCVARSIYSSSVELGKEIDFDSVSGFRLFVSKTGDGLLVVNGVRSIIGDLRKGEIVVHVMDGVIMDADFEQSI